jgi:hypothetical protein
MDIKSIRAMLTGIILLSAFMVFADEARFSGQVKDEQKDTEMQRQAAQFRAETGFKGDIIYNLDNMMFKLFGGTMPGIQLASFADTTSIRTQSEILLNSFLKYTGVPREQLKYKCWGSYVIYSQEINGIGFELGDDGYVKIDFILQDSGTSFSVYNGLQAIPEMSSQVTISEQEAYDIFIATEEAYNPKHDEYEKIVGYEQNYKPIILLKYKNIEPDKQPNVKLCWIIKHRGYQVYIDAVTGKVLKKFNTVWKNAKSNINEE